MLWWRNSGDEVVIAFRPVGLPFRVGARLALRIVGLAMFGCIALISSLPAQAGDAVSVSLERQSGFLRMWLHFPRAPNYRISNVDFIAILETDNAFSYELSRIREGFDDSFHSARVDPNGRALRFALNEGVRINVMQAAERVLIDFLPPGWSGPNPRLPTEVIDALSKRALHAERKIRAQSSGDLTLVKPRVTVGVGESQEKTRLEFRSEVAFTAEVQKKDRSVRVKLDIPATTNIDHLMAGAFDRIRSFRAYSRPNSLEYAFDLEGEFRIGIHEFPKNLILEISASESSGALKSISEQKTREFLPIDPASPTNNLPTARPDRIPSAASQLATIVASHLAVSVNQKSHAASSQIQPSQSIAGRSHAVADHPASKIVLSGSDEKKRSDGGELAGKANIMPIASPDDSAEPEKFSVGRHSEFDAPRSDRVIDANRSKAGVHRFSASVEAMPDGGFVVSLQYPMSVPAAAFSRGRRVFFAVQDTTPVDLGAIRSGFGPALENIEAVSGPNGQLLIFTFATIQYLSASLEGNQWKLGISHYVGLPRPSVELETKSDRENALELYAPVRGINKVLRFTDPLLGDTLLVGPTPLVGEIIDRPRVLIDFALLSAAQGVVALPFSEGLLARADGAGVFFSRRQGLRISANRVRGHRSETKGEEKVEPRAYQIRWRHWRSMPLNTTRAELESLAAASQSEERTRDRLNLAEFLISRELALEALAVVNVVEKDDPVAAESDRLRSLSMIANLLLGRIGDAQKKLKQLGVIARGDPTQAVWQAWIAEKNDDPESVVSLLMAARAHLTDLPPSYEISSRFLGIRAALAVNNREVARDHLLYVRRLQLSSGENELYNLYRSVLEVRERPDLSLSKFDELIRPHLEASDPRALTQARLHWVQEGVGRGFVTPAQAVQALERNLFVWRGDSLERKTMEALAPAYIAEKRFDEAFALLNRASRNFPGSKQVADLRDFLQGEFNNLFLGDGQQELSPIQALTIFYSHQLMTPVGHKGDQIIRALAERLIRIDLLDQAAGLLQYQVGNRLKGVARAQVGGKLASVHLMNRRPRLALNAIRETRQAVLPIDLLKSRTRIEAQALVELDRIDAALQLISNDQSEKADHIRMAGYWKSERWPDVAKLGERVLGETWRRTGVLNGDLRNWVLRSGVGYALAGDSIGLVRLRSKFREKMLGTAQSLAFDAITAPMVSGNQRAIGEQIAEIVQQIADSDRLKEFSRSLGDAPGHTDKSSEAG